MNALVASYARLTTLLEGAWYAIPLRLMVGYGFMEHGYAKLVRGPESFVSILHAIGVPEPSLLGGLTILIELIGGFAVLNRSVPDSKSRSQFWRVIGPFTGVRRRVAQLTGFLAKQEKDGRLLISDRHRFPQKTSVAALHAWSTQP
jgi:hypothetical protein